MLRSRVDVHLKYFVHATLKFHRGYFITRLEADLFQAEEHARAVDNYAEGGATGEVEHNAFDFDQRGRPFLLLCCCQSNLSIQGLVRDGENIDMIIAFFGSPGRQSNCSA